MVLEAKAGFESGSPGMGNGIVDLAAARRGQPSATGPTSRWAAISHQFFLRELIERIDSDWAAVEAALEAIRDLLIDRGSMVANVTAEAEASERLPAAARAASSAACRSVPGGAQSWPVRPRAKSEGLTFPGQVNYVAKGANLYALGYVQTGATSGGAAGTSTPPICGTRSACRAAPMAARSSFDPFSGGFVFTSYRDPNLLETLEVYDGAAAFLREGVGDAGPGALDHRRHRLARHLPAARRQGLHLADLGTDRQHRREPPAAARGSARRQPPPTSRALADALDAVAQKGQVVVLGSETAIKAANDERGGFLEVTQVL